MKDINEQVAEIARDLKLDDINETKKLSLLDEIGDVFTHRLILRLLKEVDKDKRELFIEKINANKADPNKILLFIDHFIDNADSIIDEEMESYRKDLQKLQ